MKRRAGKDSEKVSVAAWADSACIGWRSTGSLVAVGSAAAGAVDEAGSKMRPLCVRASACEPWGCTGGGSRLQLQHVRLVSLRLLD